MSILYTGDRGFIAGYAIKELLDSGYFVVGVDNDSKYGKVVKSYDNDNHYFHFFGDAKDKYFLIKLIKDFKVEQIILGAALIGGIKYFHTKAYDIIAENEKITAVGFDAALWGFKEKLVKKINVISSSMVFEAQEPPNKEDNLYKIPFSTYGFQKLSTEFFAKGAWEQYRLPYTVIRPFNAVGIGEYDAIKGVEENNSMVTSHVVPDLVRKVLKKDNPLIILGNGKQIRCYTYAGDIAKGIKECVENKKAINESFNISTNVQTTVLELLKIIIDLCDVDVNFDIKYVKPYKYDVKKRVPDVSKAKEILNFEANTPLRIAVKEVIDWIKDELFIIS